MKKGKTLEQVEKAIQEHLNGHSNMIVKPNVKLKDVFGIKREIDVFVYTTNQEEKSGIAFECRDHKRKVGLFEIDSFIGKYHDLPQIKKVVVVSTSGFTKEAQHKAEKYNIGLHTIEDVPYADILNIADVYRIQGKIEVPLRYYVIIEDSDTPLLYSGQKVFNIKDDKPVNIDLNIFPFILSWISHIHDKFEAQHTNPGSIFIPFASQEKWYILDSYNEKHIIKELGIIVDASLNAKLLEVTEQKQYSASSVRVSKFEQTDHKDLILINDQKSYSGFLQGEDQTLNKAPIIPQIRTK